MAIILKKNDMPSPQQPTPVNSSLAMNLPPPSPLHVGSFNWLDVVRFICKKLWMLWCFVSNNYTQVGLFSPDHLPGYLLWGPHQTLTAQATLTPTTHSHAQCVPSSKSNSLSLLSAVPCLCSSSLFVLSYYGPTLMSVCLSCEVSDTFLSHQQLKVQYMVPLCHCRSMFL